MDLDPFKGMYRGIDWGYIGDNGKESGHRSL